MEQSDKIFIACTGGTLDSFYDPDGDVPHYVPQDGQTAVPLALEELNITDDCVVKRYGSYDSKDLFEERDKHMGQIIRDAVEGGYNKVIVTMGTDTMPDMARYMKKRLHTFGDAAKDLTIIFTGSMTPLRDENKQFRPQSDAVENIGFAVETLKTEPAKGVYVAMHANGVDRTLLLNPDFLSKKVYTDSKPGDRDAKVVGSGFIYQTEKARAAELLGRDL